MGARHEVLEMKLGEDFRPEAILATAVCPPTAATATALLLLPFPALSLSFIRVFKESTISSREPQAFSRHRSARPCTKHTTAKGRLRSTTLPTMEGPTLHTGLLAHFCQFRSDSERRRVPDNECDTKPYSFYARTPSTES